MFTSIDKCCAVLDHNAYGTSGNRASAVTNNNDCVILGNRNYITHIPCAPLPTMLLQFIGAMHYEIHVDSKCATLFDCFSHS